MHKLVKILFLACIFCHVSSLNAEQILYQYRTWSINGSKFGPIALFQAQLKQKLADCGSSQTLTPDGAFGPGTRKSIIAVTQCPDISAALGPESPARQGAITDVLWSLIVKEQAAPDVAKRAAALKLTFENTDYDQMQWNFCQNKPFYDPGNGQDTCFSNDRIAFITWGPHGATAGHGAEVQGILHLYLQDDDVGREEIFNAAFGNEAKSVKRLLGLKKDTRGTVDGPIEVYLCSIWTNRNRRELWREGFKKLGQQADIQDIYRKLYAAQNFDGGKVKRFYNAWRNSDYNLPVTELDHAFFIDRSAHMGISREALLNSLAKLKSSYDGSWPPAPAVVRRHVSNTVVPSNRKQDRLGRDVAYYVAAIPFDSLSSKEQKAWKLRGARNAVDVGLSDNRLMGAYSPATSINLPKPNGQTSASETCSEAVLNPKSPF